MINTIVKIVGAHCMCPNDSNPIMILNKYGKIVKNEIIATEKIRKNIRLHNFVVMPNHIHLIIEINENNGHMQCAPTVNNKDLF